MSQNKHIVLIDVSGLIHRAWSVAPKKRNQDGQEFGATEVFSRMVMKLLRKMSSGKIPPDGVMMFFDPPRSGTWRRQVSAEYKAKRPPMDDDLVSQIPLMRALCEDLGIPAASCPTHEVDDMIAAYAHDARESGVNVSVIAADKDLLQLVRKGVMQFNPMSEKWFNSNAVREKMGVNPEQVSDYLALTGDEGDGVKGAPGIGPKTAVKLLGEFSSVPELLAHADKIENKNWRKIITENADQIRLAHRLVSLDVQGCPRPVPLALGNFPDLREASLTVQRWEQEVFKTESGTPEP